MSLVQLVEAEIGGNLGGVGEDEEYEERGTKGKYIDADNILELGHLISNPGFDLLLFGS